MRYLWPLLFVPGIALAGPCPGTNEPAICPDSSYSPTLPPGYGFKSCQSTYQYCEAIGDGPSYVVLNPAYVDPPGSPPTGPAEGFSAGTPAAPEISAIGAIPALTLLAGVLLLVSPKRRR